MTKLIWVKFPAFKLGVLRDWNALYLPRSIKTPHWPSRTCSSLLQYLSLPFLPPKQGFSNLSFLPTEGIFRTWMLTCPLFPGVRNNGKEKVQARTGSPKYLDYQLAPASTHYFQYSSTHTHGSSKSKHDIRQFNFDLFKGPNKGNSGKKLRPPGWVPCCGAQESLKPVMVQGFALDLRAPSHAAANVISPSYTHPHHHHPTGSPPLL